MSLFTLPSGVREIRRSRVSTTGMGFKARGVLVYECKSASIMYNFSAGLLGMPVQFNPNFPTMRVVALKETVNDPKNSGRSILTVTCEGASPSTNQLNRAYLTYRLIPHGREMVKDLEGNIVRGSKVVKGAVFDGEFVEGDAGSPGTEGGADIAKMRYYRPEEGDRWVDYEGTEEITLHTAFRKGEIDWQWISDMRFGINDADLPLLNGVKKNEVKMMAAGVPRYHILGPDDEVIPVNFTFFRHPGGGVWPITTKVIEFEQQVKFQPVVAQRGDEIGYQKPDGTFTKDIAEAQTAQVLLPTPIGTPERTVNKEVDMSRINGLLAWK